MTMHRAILFPPVEPDQFSGRRTRIADIRKLLAVLAARQRILPTAVFMRSGNMHGGAAPADRMVRLFVAPGAGRTGAGGAFNAGVAGYLSGTEEGESGVYRGA
jgi:hypothetical protein